uniref:Uncharacterized protein n=1 Tax=Setaria viridis TaxID=4556 RepID=A0A4U6V5S1_SETVI|nr:hypothetical protein SEVIR_3G007025v2 [Setaria viridis]
MWIMGVSAFFPSTKLLFQACPDGLQAHLLALLVVTDLVITYTEIARSSKIYLPQQLFLFEAWLVSFL